MNTLSLHRLRGLCICLVSFVFSLQAQEKEENDPRQQANSRVVDARTEIVCKSMTQAIEKESRIITIFNKKGLDAARFYCGCDKFRSLQKFSGELLNASGEAVRKIKKSELQKSEYSSTSLTTDDYFYYYECHFPSFPFTVKYEWEVKCDNGLISFPSFMPQEDYEQGVEHASYRIELPVGQPCRYRLLHWEGIDIQVTESAGAEGQPVVEMETVQIPPLHREPYAPALTELLPRVYFSPSAFRYDGSEGRMDDWQQYGAWLYSLLDGRDRLDKSLKAQLHERVSRCATDREKVKAVYDYLAETTRYVSIQLGIGGLQPIAAADVCRTGFGDCKGLSNYARAMLAELGIPSVYTVISTVNRRLLPDFASVNQMNHAILQVPLPGDTLWLECTNPQLPFGYVHQDIAGHDALLVLPEGGKLCRLPDYPDSLNVQGVVATVRLSSTAGAEAEVCETAALCRYEDLAGVAFLDPARRKDRLRSAIYLSQADVRDVRVDEHKEDRPSITLCYGVDSQQYGTVTGNRLFVPVNVFRRSFGIRRSGKRLYPVCVDRGYVNSDSICLQLPEGYAVEGLPRPVEVSGQFGQFRSSVRVEGQVVTVVQRLYLRRGTYPAEDCEAFADFCRQVSGQYNGRIVLKKASGL